MKQLTDEERLAVLCLAREFEIDRRHIGNFDELFIQSLGRLLLRDWRRIDAIDSEIMQTEDGPKSTTGWSSLDEIMHTIDSDVSTMSASQLRSKWELRVRLWIGRHRADICHILDWLSAAAREVQPWTQRRDALGRVPKMMKFSSLGHLIQEANKDHARWNAPIRPGSGRVQLPTLTDDDQVFVMDLGDGHTLVRLLTPASLDFESHHLRHCIGRGSYDRFVISGLMHYYSVRDEAGVPNATLEVRTGEARLAHWMTTSDGVTPDFDGRIEQFRGYLNAKPSDELHSYLDVAASTLRWAFAEDIEQEMAAVADAPQPRGPGF